MTAADKTAHLWQYQAALRVEDKLIDKIEYYKPKQRAPHKHFRLGLFFMHFVKAMLPLFQNTDFQKKKKP